MRIDSARARAANYIVENEDEEDLYCGEENWTLIQGYVAQPAPCPLTPAAGEGNPHSHFQTISYNTLFFNFLKNVSIRKRPPASLCDMCVGSSALKLEVILLDSMTGLGGEVEEGEEDYQEWHWREYKTRDGAVARLKLCTRMLQARDQHKIWVASQRIAVSPHVCARYSHLCFQVKTRRAGLQPLVEILVWLDYGTIYDSAVILSDCRWSTIVRREVMWTSGQPR